MATKTVEQRIRAIVVEYLGVNPEEIKPESRFLEDLTADSLDAVELAIAIEEEFDMEIPEEEAEKIKTFGELLDYVEKRTGQE